MNDNKELDAWERIKKGIDTNIWECGYWDDIETIEKALKALDIIKTKDVNILAFKTICKKYYSLGYDCVAIEYNRTLGAYALIDKLNSDECYLLKEVL